jgi:hypothetical protein
MYSAPYLLPILIKYGFYPQSLIEIPSIKFQKICAVVAVLLCVERLTDGQIDRERVRRTDITTLIGEIFDYANAPKIVNNDDAN